MTWTNGFLVTLFWMSGMIGSIAGVYYSFSFFQRFDMPVQLFGLAPALTSIVLFSKSAEQCYRRFIRCKHGYELEFHEQVAIVPVEVPVDPEPTQTLTPAIAQAAGIIAAGVLTAMRDHKLACHFPMMTVATWHPYLHGHGRYEPEVIEHVYKHRTARPAEKRALLIRGGQRRCDTVPYADTCVLLTHHGELYECQYESCYHQKSTCEVQSIPDWDSRQSLLELWVTHADAIRSRLEQLQRNNAQGVSSIKRTKTDE